MTSAENLQVILEQILVWIGREIIRPGITDGLQRFLSRHMDEWREYVRDLTDNGLEWGLEELTRLRSRIMEVVKQNRDELARCIKTSITAGSKVAAKATRVALTTAVKQSTSEVVKSGTKTATIAAAKCTTSRVTAKVASELVENGTKQVVASTVKKTTSKATAMVASELVENGTKQVVKTTATSATGTLAKAANPVGFGSDIAQFGLEVAGYEKTGKAVGATGNVISGGMTGFVIGGPPGAAVGSAAGLAVWTAGEIVGYLTSKAIDKVTNSNKHEENKQEKN